MHKKHNTKHKLILKAAKCKRTRKMKGGWNPFKSKPAASPIAPSNTGNGPIKSSDVIKASTAVAAITTLGSIATDYLANPAAITTITGLVGISSFATGGAVVVVLLVVAAAWTVLKEKQKAYKGLILVMDELYLVIQKLNGIVEISMYIAATYGFPIDTRDVQLALDAILAKFDELLDPTTGYTEIKKELSDIKKLKSNFNAAEGQVKEELANKSEGDDAGDKPTISLWTKVTTKVSNSNAAKWIKQNIEFSAPKFVQELNEAVTYLALYVGIFSASFSTTYTTVALQLLVNDRKDELKVLQTMVFGDNKFISMIEGAFVYPLLQSKKTYETCMVKTDANNSKCDAIFYTTAENVRKGMLRSFDTTTNVVTGELFSKMTNLKAVVANYKTPIPNATDATKFADEVKVAFNADKSRVTPSSATSVTQSNSTQSSATQSSATQSSATQSSATSVTSAPPPSATPSNTSATPPSVTSATPPSATNSSPSNTSATQSSASVTQSNTSVTPSNTSVTPSNTSVTPSSVSKSSVTPSNTSATSSSVTPLKTSVKNANPISMPVMQQSPEAVAQLSEVAAASAGGG